MKRAAVLIGVRDTGGLPRLQTVFSGVSMMAEWATDQGITGESLAILTDEHEPVTAVKVLEAITRLVEKLTYEQLIIYYTGHGLNLGQSEFWLLSDFPANATTIINLSATMERARTGPIPHVVFISDACRTPVGNIVQQVAALGGMAAFPNPTAADIGTFKSVDVFYATVLGRPSLEINAENRFRGVYTEALVDALNGKPPIMADPVPDEVKVVIRPWPLREYLDREIPKRLLSFFPTNPPTQIPDAIISSKPSSWISELSPPQPPEPQGRGPVTPEPEPESSRTISLPNFSFNVLRGALDTDSHDLTTVFSHAKSDGDVESEATRSFQESALSTSQPFGRKSFETRCGFMVQGGTIVEAFSNDATVEIVEREETSCRVALPAHAQFSQVLLTFDSGKSALLPAIRDFLTGLKFDAEADELIDVSYEPSQYSDRWGEFEYRKAKLRSLRAIIAASTRMGTFQLEGENDADDVARDMQVAKGLDPSLAVYAAYAYRKQGNQDRLNQMFDYLYNDLNFIFFDVAMLAGKLPSDIGSHWSEISPPWPLLTQGWAMLEAFNIELPDQVKELRKHLDFKSVWSLYNEEGANLLKNL